MCGITLIKDIQRMERTIKKPDFRRAVRSKFLTGY